jgi:hypothetical protein
MRSGAGEKGVLTRVNEYVQDRVLERSIDRVAMRFPAPIGQIEFNAPANDLFSIYANRGPLKIGTRLAVPCAELDNLDRLATDTSKAAAEVAGKPARLQLQFVRVSRSRKKGALPDAAPLSQFLVPIRGRRLNQHAASGYVCSAGSGCASSSIGAAGGALIRARR